MMNDFDQYDQTYSEALARAQLSRLFETEGDDRDLLVGNSPITSIAKMLALSPTRNPIDYHGALHFQLLAQPAHHAAGDPAVLFHPRGRGLRSSCGCTQALESSAMARLRGQQDHWLRTGRSSRS